MLSSSRSNHLPIVLSMYFTCDTYVKHCGCRQRLLWLPLTELSHTLRGRIGTTHTLASNTLAAVRLQMRLCTKMHWHSL